MNELVNQQYLNLKRGHTINFELSSCPKDSYGEDNLLYKNR